MKSRDVVGRGAIGRLLDQWVTTLEMYCVRHDWTDVPWWGRERSAIGILAAAAWGVDGAALEEYSVDKRDGRGSRQNAGRKGRQDLYLRIGSDAFVCEAKHFWCNLRSERRAWAVRVREALAAATRDVNRKDHGKFRRLAIVFISPVLHRDWQVAFDSKLPAFIEFISSLDAGWRAWFFPPEAKTFPEAKKLRVKDDDYMYPGAVILVNEVQ